MPSIERRPYDCGRPLDELEMVGGISRLMNRDWASKPPPGDTCLGAASSTEGMYRLLPRYMDGEGKRRAGCSPVNSCAPPAIALSVKRKQV